MEEKKSALLIGNFRYEDPVLRQLVAPAQDVEALAKVLQDPRIGGFELRTLLNQPSHKLSEEIEAFFSDRMRDELLLLYFSGHGVKDEDGKLYFATANTNYFLRLAYALVATAILMVVNSWFSTVRSYELPLGSVLFVESFGIVSGCIVSGWLSDRFGRLNVLRWMIAIAVGAIAPYVLRGRVYFLEPFILPLMYCCYGGVLPVNAAAAVDFWGTKNAGENYGMLYSAWAAALILAPWFTEFLSHRFDNSKLVAYVSVVLAMLALVSARRAQAPRDLANAVT